MYDDLYTIHSIYILHSIFIFTGSYICNIYSIIKYSLCSIYKSLYFVHFIVWRYFYMIFEHVYFLLSMFFSYFWLYMHSCIDFDTLPHACILGIVKLCTFCNVCFVCITHCSVYLYMFFVCVSLFGSCGFWQVGLFDGRLCLFRHPICLFFLFLAFIAPAGLGWCRWSSFRC